MRIRDANVLREALKANLENASKIGRVIAEEFIDVIDEIPEIEVVPLEEFEALERRFRHLVSSEYIASFDRVDTFGEYVRDIVEAGSFDRHGNWKIFGADKRGRGGVFVCTSCNKPHPNISQYCPNCGAKMDGGKNDGHDAYL